MSRRNIAPLIFVHTDLEVGTGFSGKLIPNASLDAHALVLCSFNNIARKNGNPAEKQKPSQQDFISVGKILSALPGRDYSLKNQSPISIQVN